MPKTRAQKIVFSLLMSLIMVYGMEVYNHIIAGRADFTVPPLELAGLMIAVIALQELFAGKLARKIAFCAINPQKHRQITVTIAVQVCTVLIMCPLMSLIAALVFKGEVAAPLIVKWLQTVAFNLPMAFGWQILVAGPIVRGVVRRV